MIASFLFEFVQWFVVVYFLLLNGGYITLSIISLFSLLRTEQEKAFSELPQAYAQLEPPISILVPAYNEEATIAASIRSLLQLSYSEFEIIVINDGSKDATMAVLLHEFAMLPFPEAYRVQLKTKPLRAIYRSTRYPNLRVIDKDNGGKADSLNAGINASRFPLFCGVDADSILQRDSLQRVVKPFMEAGNVVASGGTVRIANGCQVSDGFMTKVGLPTNIFALLQVVEYLRAFLFGRLGWSSFNSILIISGAFGLFRKQTVIDVGGYRTDTIGEDMELVVRMHRILRQQRKSYRIQFVADPVCWTEAPEDYKTLKNQRIRWQQGLSQSLTRNWGLMFSRTGGAPGWIAFPFMVFFEWLGPMVEVGGYLFMAITTYLGILDYGIVVLFLLVAIGLGIMLSLIGILLDEMAFHIYPKTRHLVWLLVAVLIENFGYRQLNTCWRIIGLIRFMKGGEGKWGEMKRKANWQAPGAPSTSGAPVSPPNAPEA